MVSYPPFLSENFTMTHLIYRGAFSFKPWNGIFRIGYIFVSWLVSECILISWIFWSNCKLNRYQRTYTVFVSGFISVYVTWYFNVCGDVSSVTYVTLPLDTLPSFINVQYRMSPNYRSYIRSMRTLGCRWFFHPSPE